MKRTTRLRDLKKITFVIEEFAVRSPSQQLLDRFLIGYPRDGEFHRLNPGRMSVHLVGEGSILNSNGAPRILGSFASRVYKGL